MVRPSRLAPNNDVASIVMYPNCTSNETGQYLLKVADTANRIKALKADPAQVAVVSIQGPATPYTVTWRNPSIAGGDTSCGAASCPWPAIAHSCTASDSSFADPGVRTTEFVQAFGGNGLVLPICSSDLSPSLDRAAMLINSLSARCIPGLVGESPTTGLADCKVTARYRERERLDRRHDCARVRRQRQCGPVLAAGEDAHVRRGLGPGHLGQSDPPGVRDRNGLL